jgi:endonuclease/exonuclease/phosphatase family metal-dependent hydrolase
MNTDAHRDAGWIAEEIMSVPTVSVPASGRLPATAESFTVALACVTPGKVRMQFQFKVCEEPAAVWDAGSSGCSEGAAQTVTFVVDKECGDSNALPDFCLPASPRAMIQLGEPAAVSVFNLNVAEGAGVDRTKLVAKGTAIAAVIEQTGSAVACLQEVWDEGEKGALTAGLATAGLSHTVYARGAGLLIASRYPIVRCGAATFPADSYGDTIESFTQKGVLGALLDIGGGALLYVFVTHMAAFSELSGSQAQLATIKQEMQSRISEAAAIYGPPGRIGVVVMGDFNLNAATPEVRTGQTRCFTRKSQTKSV